MGKIFSKKNQSYDMTKNGGSAVDDSVSGKVTGVAPKETFVETGGAEVIIIIFIIHTALICHLIKRACTWRGLCLERLTVEQRACPCEYLSG